MVRINTTAAETRVLVGLLGAAALLGAFQLLLQASPVVVLLCVLSGLFAILPCFVYGLSTTVGILYLMVWFQFSFGALLTKSILLQPLDSNLFEPVLSHLILLTGAATFCAAALLAFFFIPLHKNLLRPELSPGKLSSMAVIFTALWASALVIGKLGANGAAIAAFLRNYIFFALICETAATILRTSSRRSFSPFGATLFAVTAGFSIAVNSKAGILAAGICYFLTLFAFNRRPSLRVLGVLIPTLALLTVAINPAIHVVRAQRDRLGPLEILAETTSTAVGILIGDAEATSKVRDLRRQDYESGYNLYRNQYLGRSGLWFDRFILTGYIDAITRRVSYGGPFFGLNSVLSQTAEALPRQFYGGEKSRYSYGARITRTLGLTERDAAVSPTVPLPIETFVAGGFPAIPLIGIPTLMLAVAGLNLLAFRFKANVWAVGLLAVHGYFFAVQTYAGYVFFLLRKLPTDALVITLVAALSTVMMGMLSRQGRPLQVPPRRSIAPPSKP